MCSRMPRVSKLRTRRLSCRNLRAGGLLAVHVPRQVAVYIEEPAGQAPRQREVGIRIDVVLVIDPLRRGREERRGLPDAGLLAGTPAAGAGLELPRIGQEDAARP